MEKRNFPFCAAQKRQRISSNIMQLIYYFFESQWRHQMKFLSDTHCIYFSTHLFNFEGFVSVHGSMLLT